MAGKKKEKVDDNGLQLTIDAINKEFGAGSLFRVGNAGRVIEAPKLSSGSPKLDMALGGGYPDGRVIEIFGPESSGKTTLCLHAIREAQQRGGVAAIVDAEHALDLKYAQSLGVDVETLLVAQPNTGEEALNIADRLIRTGKIAIVVIDSVAALVPKAELEGEIGDSHVGLQSRMMSQALRMIVGKAQETGTIVYFTNQIRMKIGILFGNPETTSGGQALKYYASQRLDIRRVSSEKNSDGESISNRVRVKVIKNKVAPPFREAEIEIEFGTGLNVHAEIFDLAIEFGFIQQSGSWMTFPALPGAIENSFRLQGRGSCVEFLKRDTSYFDKLEEMVRNRIFKTTAQMLAEAPPSEEAEESFDE